MTADDDDTVARLRAKLQAYHQAQRAYEHAQGGVHVPIVWLVLLCLFAALGVLFVTLEALAYLS